MNLTIARYDRNVLMAVRSLFDGVATEGQQKKAMEWIVLNCARIGQTTYQQGDTHASAFAEGMRFVGLQIAKMREPEALAQLEAWEKSGSKKQTTTEARGEK